MGQEAAKINKSRRRYAEKICFSHLAFRVSIFGYSVSYNGARHLVRGLGKGPPVRCPLALDLDLGNA